MGYRETSDYAKGKVATMLVKIGGMFVNMANVTHVEVVEANKYNVRHVRFYLNHILDGIQNYVVFDDANDIEAALRYLDNFSFDADDADDEEYELAVAKLSE